MKKFFQKVLISDSLRDLPLSFTKDDDLPIVMFTFSHKPVIVGMAKIMKQENSLYVKAEILDDFPFDNKENYLGVAGEFMNNKNKIEGYFINRLLYLVNPKITE